jgi:oxygen-independent coproporphyrinogen-3 oxidase
MLHLALVMALMCQGRVDFESIELGHLVHVPTYFANELARLKDLEQQGLLVLGPSGIDITPTGWYLVRAIAMVFDKHLGQRSTQAEQTVRFSRVI